MRVSKQLFDAVVVGSGGSGGWVAKQLTEQGMSVLMLEAGPPRILTRDFTEHVRPYQVKFRGFGNRQALLERQPIQRLCFACDKYSHQFFVDDHENPYTFPVDKPFMWIRSRQVGGRTFCWGRECYRYSDYEFKAASRDGYGEDWPIIGPQTPSFRYPSPPQIWPFGSPRPVRRNSSAGSWPVRLSRYRRWGSYLAGVGP